MSDNFIPFTKKEINKIILSLSKSEDEKKKLKKIMKMVEAYFHCIYHRKLESLKEHYIAVDPDMKNNIFNLDEENINILEKEELIENEFSDLLKAGNYNEIEKEDIEQAFEGHSPWGIDLKVDFSKIKNYMLFYRGKYRDYYNKNYAKIGQKSFGKIEKKYEFDVYSRVVLMFTLNEKKEINSVKNENNNLKHGKLYIKLFKNVPVQDLEMVFPSAKVSISILDKLMVIVPLSIGLFSTGGKFIQYVLSEGKSMRIWSQVGFWTLVGGLFLFAIKSFFNYKNIVQKYLKNLTESLYFQNLDNNGGVFKTVLDDAEEQEYKETMLAYAFLLKAAGNGAELEEMDKDIEKYFEDSYNYKFDFEADDAVKKLIELQIASKNNTFYKVDNLDNTIKILEDKWIKLIDNI